MDARGGIYMIKKYWHLMLAAIILLSVVGYQYVMKIGIDQINTTELAEMLQQEKSGMFFVDVREVHEYKDGHIEGMVNIPLSVLQEEYHQIPQDKEVVIICRSGNRSMQAANILKDLGYTKLVNVTGGMLDWDGDVSR